MKTDERMKQDIYEAYIGGMSVRDIGEMCGLTPSSVSRIAAKMGASGRRRRMKVGQTTAKICAACKKVIEVNGAKFCCFCGTDIRSPREHLIERIESAMPILKYLPESVKDEVHTLFIDIRNELRKEVQK